MQSLYETLNYSLDRGKLVSFERNHWQTLLKERNACANRWIQILTQL